MFSVFSLNGQKCECGKEHFLPKCKVISGQNVLESIVEVVKEFNAKKVFVLSDKNTFTVCASKVLQILDKNNIKYTSYTFNEDKLEPDEQSVGSAIMHYDYQCDLVVGVGSGVINDIGKILSATAKTPYVIIGTAPSMDGFASATSSMTRDGLKISLNSKCADVIIGDLEIMKNAPMHMLKSGLGDMIAKYVSICEWRISNIITGEYYCERTAQIVRNAVKKCVDNASGLLNREVNAVKAVFEGLVVCGAAMAYVGCSRPASGVEHYFSHVWDMRAITFDLPIELHGIQCAVGTYIACSLYEKIKKIRVDKEKAKNFVQTFDYDNYSKQLKDFLGRSAISMIELEKKEQKYDKAKHSLRLDVIENKWQEILQIIDEEIPNLKQLTELFDKIGLPKTLKEIYVDENLLYKTFISTKDIRDKYVLSRLAWDLGVIDEMIN
ncbi:MAG: sn-glycerol-1-phosphate dehydrogenase [Clostridiales bacterium]|nr:sn-glycerol-1-phosphate dehydrogenase [Clostridiales bacterium]